MDTFTFHNMPFYPSGDNGRAPLGAKSIYSTIYRKTGLIAGLVAICLLTCCGNCRAQWITKKDALCAASGFAIGAMWGTHEITRHNYSAFSYAHPKADAQYWNPAISWENKYWRGVPAHISDAKHVLASGTQIGLFATGIVIGRKCTLKSVLRNTAYFTTGYVAGNFIAYDVPINKWKKKR